MRALGAPVRHDAQRHAWIRSSPYFGFGGDNAKDLEMVTAAPSNGGTRAPRNFLRMHSPVGVDAISGSAISRKTGSPLDAKVILMVNVPEGLSAALHDSALAHAASKAARAAVVE